MSWGIELWDQMENISIHTQRGIDFCEKFLQFIKERCIIENEYASKLKKLTKNYQPKRKEEDCEFSYVKGFVGMLNEIHDIAGQHELIVENLMSLIVKDLQLLLQQVKQERKKHLQCGAKQFNSLQTQMLQLEKAKKQYDKAFKESEKSQELFKKADADIHMSRADVEKTKNTMVQKQQLNEESKNDFASELQKTNDCQREHFQILMPQVFQQLQEMEENRIKKMKELLNGCSDVERNILPIINTCIDGLVKSAEIVNATEDSKVVVEKYKSGFVPPADIPFEDLNNMLNSNENHSPNVNSRSSTMRADSIKGMMRAKKRTGLFAIFSGSKTDESKENYSHLPPNQQKKKLIQKIDSIKTSLAKETAERDGMLKMQDVYQQNPALGDPQSVSKQLEENAQKLDKLRLELQKFEGYLGDVDKSNRLSGNESSWSTTTTDRSSVSLTTLLGQHNSPVMSNVGNSQDVINVNNKLENVLSGGAADRDSFDEESKILGICVALYAFNAPSEGSISMDEGEEFKIIEKDEGDGWMRVQRNNGGEEGFVPTSYVECHFQNS